MLRIYPRMGDRRRGFKAAWYNFHPRFSCYALLFLVWLFSVLAVGDAPPLTNYSQITALVGQDKELNCSNASNQNVKWTFKANAENIDERKDGNSRYVKEENAANKRNLEGNPLILKNVTKEDAGTYTCQYEDSGWKFETINLSVEVKPDVTSLYETKAKPPQTDLPPSSSTTNTTGTTTTNTTSIFRTHKDRIIGGVSVAGVVIVAVVIVVILLRCCCRQGEIY